MHPLFCVLVLIPLLDFILWNIKFPESRKNAIKVNWLAYQGVKSCLKPLSIPLDTIIVCPTCKGKVEKDSSRKPIAISYDYIAKGHVLVRYAAVVYFVKTLCYGLNLYRGILYKRHGGIGEMSHH